MIWVSRSGMKLCTAPMVSGTPMPVVIFKDGEKVVKWKYCDDIY